MQEKWRKDLVKKALNTQFGKDHFFKDIESYADFREAVPVHDDQDLSAYIAQLKNGESDVLWPGKPLYFAKTSGTTSGTKYIPISKDSISNHIDSARNAILTYIAETKKAQFLDKKFIFLSGSPILTETFGADRALVRHFKPPRSGRSEIKRDAQLRNQLHRRLGD